MPAQAGIQHTRDEPGVLDSRLRGNDGDIHRLPGGLSPLRAFPIDL